MQYLCCRFNPITGKTSLKKKRKNKRLGEKINSTPPNPFFSIYWLLCQSESIRGLESQFFALQLTGVVNWNVTFQQWWEKPSVVIDQGDIIIPLQCRKNTLQGATSQNYRHIIGLAPLQAQPHIRWAQPKVDGAIWAWLMAAQPTVPPSRWDLLRKTASRVGKRRPWHSPRVFIGTRAQVFRWLELSGTPPAPGSPHRVPRVVQCARSKLWSAERAERWEIGANAH